MTRQYIQNSISKKSLDQMRTIRIYCRPLEKSGYVLMATIGKHRWYADRPKYFWTPFDLGFMKKGLLAEQKMLYPNIREPLTIFDDRGLFWGREEMSSFGLVKHFTQHPAQYLRMMLTHTRDTEYVVQELQRMRPTLSDPQHFVKNFTTFVALYARFYRMHGTIFLAFDEMAWQFRELLLKYCEKEVVNRYFPRFLSGAITQEALKRGYVLERGNVEHLPTRGVLYGMSMKPRAFYVAPKVFHDYPEDQHVIARFTAPDIPKKESEAFFAFRMMVPLGFQISEESQYIETAGLSAHLGILIRAIAKKLKLSLEEIQKMTVPQIIRLLQK